MAFLIVPAIEDAKGVILDQIGLLHPLPDEKEINQAIAMGTALFRLCGLANEYEVLRQIFPALLSSMLARG